VRGAFTSATQDRAGLLEQLHGGTLFLDEIADLDGRTQSLLLRVIQEGEFSRVGETRLRKTHVRLLSATNRVLRDCIANGSFRLDLFFRIAEDQIELPPLRRRLEDLPDLTRHFASIHSPTPSPPQFERSFFDRLRTHSWPGNVRELAGYLRKLFVLHPECGSFGGSHLPDFLLEASAREELDLCSLAALEEEFRRATVLNRLESMGWNITRSAASLGLSRQRLSTLIHQWGLGPSDSEADRKQPTQLRKDSDGKREFAN
jgi:DNA-binding NtrC family response regulator